MALPYPCRVVVRGGGEMGSGVAWRLFRCGFHVIIAETDRPTAVRRWVAFSEAVYDGEQTIEVVTARLCGSHVDTASASNSTIIPVVICPDPERLSDYHPDVIVDAILAKRNTGVRRGMAPSVIGLGPGFVAGEDVDCVIETNRGANLGRCIWRGSAEANTGIPGSLAGETARRVLRAPADGVLEAVRSIGDSVRAGDVVARVDSVPVTSALDGVVRGMIRPGLSVTRGTKIGDVDPRGDVDLCRRISDKALGIAGGVLEGILYVKR